MSNNQGNMALPAGEDKMPEAECRYIGRINATIIESDFQFRRIKMNFKRMKGNNTEIHWRNLAKRLK